MTLDLRTNQAFTASFQKLACSFANTTAYNIYRFQIDRVANPAQAVAMQLDELEFLLVLSPYSYFWAFGDGATSTNQNPQHTYATNGICTATLVVSDGLSTATNTVTIYAAPPALTASRPGAGGLTLSWPTWASRYTLYSNTNLAAPVVWSRATDATLATNDGNIVASFPATNKTRFFRLLDSN